MWRKFNIPRELILTADSNLKKDDAYTETISHLTPIPDANASENKQIIIATLNNIELSNELKEYWKYRMTALTLNDQVTQEDHGWIDHSRREREDHFIRKEKV